MPVSGAGVGFIGVGEAPQQCRLMSICALTTGTGGQGQVDVSGFNGAQMIEMVWVGSSGNATVAVEGSLDGTNWYTLPMQQVAFAAAPGNGVVPGTQVLTTGSIAHGTRQYWQVTMPARFIQLDITANNLASGTAPGFSATLFATPV